MKSVQKFITIMIWLVTVLMVLLAFINGEDASSNIFVAIAMSSGCMIVTILYFLPIPERIKAIAVLVLLGLACHGISISMGGNSWTFIGSFLILGFAILFYDPKVLLIYSAIYLTVSVIIHIVNPIVIPGPITPATVGMFEIIAYAMMSASLYIGTKTGSRIIQQAVEDEKDAHEKSLLIEQNSNAAHKNVLSLYENISNSDENMKVLSNEADNVNVNVTQLKKSELETIRSFQILNEKVMHSTQMIEDNYQLIRVLEENFMTALSNVEEGKSHSSNASESLNDILVTILHARECIEKSTKEVVEIGSILNNIEEIASRTNLLAINASIEAARTSEAGKGFHIVAEQIRTLSIQSKRASENVKKILDGLNQSLSTTGMKINNGLSAIQLGISNLDHIVNGLEIVDLYSNQSKLILNKEVEVFEKMKNDFTEIVHEVESSMQMAKNNMDEIQVVADSVQSQANRTVLVTGQLEEMEELANQIKEQFA